MNSEINLETALAQGGSQPSYRSMAELIGSVQVGTVASFDADLGLGDVSVFAAGKELLVDFHAIVISDGTREVLVGSAVVVTVVASVLGQIEAGTLIKL